MSKPRIWWCIKTPGQGKLPWTTGERRYNAIQIIVDEHQVAGQNDLSWREMKRQWGYRVVKIRVEEVNA